MGKGYKASYMSLNGDFVVISDKNINSIPNEIVRIFKEWKIYGQAHQEEYYKNGNYCPVKGASEVFRYNGINYSVMPEFFGLYPDYFEYIMIKFVEDALVEIGAEEVFCTAMID